MTDGKSDQKEPEIISETELIAVIKQIILETQREDGYRHLSTIGGVVHQQFSTFTPRQYGYRKLLDLMQVHAGRLTIKRSATKSSVWVGFAPSAGNVDITPNRNAV